MGRISRFEDWEGIGLMSAHLEDWDGVVVVWDGFWWCEYDELFSLLLLLPPPPPSLPLPRALVMAFYCPS